jgi:U1 small nuclear ribonucleoprotein
MHTSFLESNYLVRVEERVTVTVTSVTTVLSTYHVVWPFHCIAMPGTHLLPPNLLKLFAPRPPLPYTRPVDKDIDRIRPKNVSGVAHLIAQLKEAKTEDMLTTGESDVVMEEGEEPVFTHAEEVKRQIRREERKKKKTEEFKIAKETCVLIFLCYHPSFLTHFGSDKPADDPEAVGDPYKTLFISRLVHSRFSLLLQGCLLTMTCSIKPPQKVTFAASLKHTAPSSG